MAREALESAPRCTTTSEVPATRSNAAAARTSVRWYQRRRTICAGAISGTDGITPPGTSSSAVRIRDDAAISPRASATIAAHSAHSATCASIARRLFSRRKLTVEPGVNRSFIKMLHSSPSLRALVAALHNSRPVAVGHVTTSFLPIPATARVLLRSPSSRVLPLASAARVGRFLPERRPPFARAPLPALARASIGSGSTAALALLLCQQRQVPPPTCILSRFVSHEIRRNCKQPCPFVRERLLPQRAQECLLRHLFRPIAVAEPPRQVSHERGVVGSEETVDVAQVVTSLIEDL